MSKTIVFQNPEGKIVKYSSEKVADMMVRQRSDAFKQIPDSYETKEVNKYSYRPIGEE